MTTPRIVRAERSLLPVSVTDRHREDFREEAESKPERWHGGPGPLCAPQRLSQTGRRPA